MWHLPMYIFQARAQYSKPTFNSGVDERKIVDNILSFQSLPVSVIIIYYRSGHNQFHYKTMHIVK